MTDRSTIETQTITVPGAEITYDVRGDLTGGVTPLLIVGAPMDAGGFTALAEQLPARPVVTYDPRNVGRSTRAEPTAAVTPEQHADDLHTLLQELDAGAVDVFASSGGAVNALVLVSRHPDDIRTLVAHEPPLGTMLPDGDRVSAVCADLLTTYDSAGEGPAMAKFIAFVMHRGFVPTDYLDRPAPDPAMFGMSSQDDGSRDSGLMTNMRGGMIDLVLDLGAVRAATTRVVIGVGEESGGPDDGELAGRAAYAVAAALDLPATTFPGGHAGFHGEHGRPVEFAARLREVLADSDR